MYRKTADERMRQLRALNRLEEIARRIVMAVDDAYEAVKNDRHEVVSGSVGTAMNFPGTS